MGLLTGVWLATVTEGFFNSMIQGTELFPGDFSSVARGSVCAESPFVLRAVRGWIFLMC
jgi:hypothetical protein